MNKKTLIATKAAELILLNGYENTKIIDIANACNISKGSVYSYYKSKEEILIDIFFKMIESEKFVAEAKTCENLLDVLLLVTNKITTITKSSLKVIALSMHQAMVSKEFDEDFKNKFLLIRNYFIKIASNSLSNSNIDDVEFFVNMVLILWRERISNYVFDESQEVQQLLESIKFDYNKILEKRY